jgi:hypothetical protein
VAAVSAASALDDQFRGSSFQHLAWAVTEHIHKLTADGVFEGQQAARAVLLYFAHHTARYTDTGKGRKTGYVLEGKATQKAIMTETGLSKATVNRAVKWLQEQGLIAVAYVYEGQRQSYGSIQISSWDAQSEADRQAWLATQQPGRVHEATSSTHHEDSQVLTMTPSSTHHEAVFNTDSYTEETTTKSDDDDIGETASQGKRLKLADARQDFDVPGHLAPAPQADGDDLALFFVGRSKSGKPYLAMEGSRSRKYPDGRKFVRGMDEGQIRLTPEQVSEYFTAYSTDTARWRELNRHYYDLAEQADPRFRRRPDKRRVNERGKEYVNDFWVQTEGERAGYFTRTSKRDQRPGEVLVTLTPVEAKTLFDIKDWMGPDLGNVENRTRRVEWMRSKLLDLGHLEDDQRMEPGGLESTQPAGPSAGSRRVVRRHLVLAHAEGDDIAAAN